MGRSLPRGGWGCARPGTGGSDLDCIATPGKVIPSEVVCCRDPAGVGPTPRRTHLVTPVPGPPTRSAAVAWRDVRKAYPDGHEALSGVSLEVSPGDCLVILGTSGSGKTTLLKMVNRLIEPTAGAVLVRGRATSEWDPIALRR